MSFTVYTRVTQMTPTDETAAASKGGAIAKTILLPGVPVPTPRLPIGLGSLSVEAEARSLDERQVAAMIWGCGANFLSGSRSIPDDPELLQRLAYYREGLNARHAGLVTFEVLSFFKVFERRSKSKAGEQNPTKLWIKSVFGEVSALLQPDVLSRFDADRKGKDVEKYVLDNCRVATAHASESFPSDADASPELRRLYSAAEVIFALARHFIQTEYKLSKLYYSDAPADE